jgi:acetyltransferase
MNFNAIFNPSSIAIVGASRRATHVGYGVLKNLIEQMYQGEIFPVNPNAEEILGRKCFANLSEIGKPVDLVIMIVHPTEVKIAMQEAVTIGVKAVIVITAGYKEIGETELENELARVCNENHITLLGPNCLGVINPSIRMNASFARIMPKAGSVGFFSQSGALCVAVLDYAEKLGIGFSKFASVGNKAQVGEKEMIQFLLDDSETNVIAMYLEDLAHPHEIIEIIQNARKAGNKKPIIALKAGRTTAGAGASASHTGALAGVDEAFNAFITQAGIIRAEKVSELFDYIKVFSVNKIPKGKKLGIITNAGGPGVLAIDEASLRGLSVNELSKDTRFELANFLPPAASTRNPVDVVGDADAVRYEKALQVVVGDKNIDMILAVLTHQTMTEVEKTATAIANIKKQTEKPIVACFMGGNSVESGIKILRDADVAMIEYPEESANAISKLALYGEYLERPEPKKFNFENSDTDSVRKILNWALGQGKKALSEYEALQVFTAYGFPVLPTEFAVTRDEVILKAGKIGKPFVMKIVSPDILHKTDFGGVRLNVLPEKAGEEFDTIIADVLAKKPDAKIEGVLLSEMAVRNGFEIILGLKRDPALGNVVMVGAGGTMVEVFRDMAFGLAPITIDDAERMIDTLKAKKILDGIRGGKPFDTDALMQMLGRLSKLVTDFPEITEIDINPIKIFEKAEGGVVLDARIILG